jgi:RimJ/RimL family protein N-acetyltransferase
VGLRGRRIELARVAPSHYAALHEIATSASMAHLWPLLGRTVPLDQFGSYLAQMAPVQLTMLRRDNGEPVGLVQGIDEDLRSRRIGLGLVVEPALWSSGWPLEGVVLFLEYLFSGLGFRKVYCHMPTSVLERTGGAMDLYLTEEGVYRQHALVGGVHEDVHILSIHRDRWDSSMARRITGNTGLGATVGTGDKAGDVG